MGSLKQAQSYNPGAVDVTSREAALDPNVSTPSSAQAGIDAVRSGSAAATTPGFTGSEEQASQEEQAEYERASDAITAVIYREDETANAVADMLQPKDKIGSTVQATLMILKQVDDQIDMDEAVIPQVMSDIADMLMDIGEQTKDMIYSDKEAQAVLGASWEGVMDLYGVDEEAYQTATAGMDDGAVAQADQQYKEFLGG